MNADLAIVVPCGLVAATSTVPDGCAGAVAVIDELLFTLNVEAAAPPNVTEVTPPKFVPVMVTLVPPAGSPEVGESLLIVGLG